MTEVSPHVASRSHLPLASPKAGSRGTAIVLLGLIGVGVTLLWLRPLASSLWLDENGTFWVIARGLRATIHRSIDIQGQSPLYYLVAYAAVKLGGTSEIVLRLPSILAMLVASWGLYRIGVRLFDRETGLLGVLVFVCLPQIAFVAADARPYGLALMFLVLTALQLLRWLDQGTGWNAAGVVLFGSLTLYSHYLFGFGLAALAVYAFLRRDRVGAARLVTTLIAMSLLCAPLIPQLISLMDRRHALNWSTTPSILAFVVVLAQPLCMIGAGIALRRMAPDPTVDTFSRDRVALLLLWAMVPPVGTFLVAVMTSMKIFEVRYYVSALPAVALLGGWAIRGIAFRGARVIVAGALITAVGLTALPVHGSERWGEAARFVRARVSNDTPVFVRSGLIEARLLPERHTAEQASFVLAPLVRYNLGGSPRALPFGLSRSEQTYIETMLADPSVSRADRIVLVTNFIHDFRGFFRTRLMQRGYVQREDRAFGAIDVTIFDRASP